MTKVFVHTTVPDIHALAVNWALEKKGHSCVLWYGTNLPEKSSMSFSIGTGCSAKWDMVDPDISIEDVESDVDVVWLRRPVFPQLPDDMHEGDMVIAEREWKRFNESLLWGFAPEAMWINPMPSLYPAESKPIQLRAAVAVGLTVSKTLFSNDPDKIKAFLTKYPDSVFKPFNQGLWEGEGRVAAAMTVPITIEQLPDDDTLRLVPGIFQQRVAKKHELRVTIFGEHAVAVKIQQNDFQHSELDSRVNLNKETVTETTLPDEILAKCIKLMKRLNIVFGCFDFIVTENDEYVFLEVNQMGQFLWIEDVCPQIPMLDIFTNFLISKSPTFKYEGGDEPSVQMSDFDKNEASRVFKEVESRHVKNNKLFQVTD